MRKKGNIGFETMFGFFIVVLVFIVALYPILQVAINDFNTNTNGTDATTSSVLVFFPAAILIVLLLGLFFYAKGTGRNPEVQQ